MMFSNWSGSVQFSPKNFFEPRSLEELQEFVARNTASKMRVVGAAHSFTPLVETNETLIRIDSLSHIEPQPDSPVVNVGAGARLWKLGPELRRLGRAQENLGDIDQQSLAGAISTGTHGTGLQFGSIATQAQWIKLLKANGELVLFDRDKNPREFRAAATSLGVLGILVEVGLRTLPAYGLKLAQFAEPLEKAISDFVARNKIHRHAEFFWFPHTKTVLTKLTDQDSVIGEERPKWKSFFSDVVLENGVFEIFNQWGRAIPAMAPQACKSLAALSKIAGGKTATGPSDRVFATARLSHFHEMEYAFSLSKLPDVIERLEKFILDEKIAVTFPVEVRAVKADDFYLGPTAGQDSVFIAVHMHQKMPYQKFFSGAEKIFRELGGRPHWGKMHTLTSAELRVLYPNWGLFNQIRKELDPRERFMNAHTQKLFS